MTAILPRFAKLKRTRVRRSKRALKQSKMIQALDVAARHEVVEVRDLETCQRCGAQQGKIHWGKLTQIQWSHVHSRRHHCLRWEPDNSKALCRECHFWWTNNPGLAYDWFIKKFPERWAKITRVLQLNPKVRVKDLYAELRGEAS